MQYNISGVILAGGGSRRMGYPKPFLEIGGRKMIDIVSERLRQFFTEIIIVTDKKEDFLRGIAPRSFAQGLGKKGLDEYRVVEDVIKGCGPLGGIYTGLMEISGDAGFFVACDMPHLHRGLVSRLVAETDLIVYECIVPKHSGGIEPLHAIYSGQILPKVKKSLGVGKLSLRELLSDCCCKYISVGEDEASSFVNINTPEDLAHCQHLSSCL